MSKSPVEKMNEFKEELEEKNPIKKKDVDSKDITTADEIANKKGSFSQTLADKSRTNKGAIGIDRDPNQM